MIIYVYYPYEDGDGFPELAIDTDDLTLDDTKSILWHDYLLEDADGLDDMGSLSIEEAYEIARTRSKKMMILNEPKFKKECEK